MFQDFQRLSDQKLVADQVIDHLRALSKQKRLWLADFKAEANSSVFSPPHGKIASLEDPQEEPVSIRGHTCT